MQKEWFTSWFDSPFYDLLYQNRDDNEAKIFVTHLIEHLAPSPHSKMLDIACGKGRFSRFLAEKGYAVTGIDLSSNSIDFAKQFENENLAFYKHDMRDPLPFGDFDYAFNFFTSFGYFEKDEDHIQTLNSIHKALKPNGIFLIDFLNAHRVVDELVPAERKKIDDAVFEIERKEEDGFIIKTIILQYHQKKMEFEEKVRAFTLVDFRDMLDKTGFVLEEVYGDYDLNPYEAESSDRLILICRKQ